MLDSLVSGRAWSVDRGIYGLLSSS